MWFKDSLISFADIDFNTELGAIEEEVEVDVGSHNKLATTSKYDSWLNKFF